VSLLWSFANPRHEERAKEIIREEYKEYHIGYLPVVLSSQVVAKLGEYERTMTAVLDAYLQRSMQNELSAMWDRLRTLGYKGSFLMIHNSGGSGEVFKTTASRTYNGGPVPGPACYDQGGTEPTVTDADVVLGYINPETYYGGRMPLNHDKAERAVREKIAEPMGIGVEQAAALIRHIVDRNMHSAIKREIHLRG